MNGPRGPLHENAHPAPFTRPTLDRHFPPETSAPPSTSAAALISMDILPPMPVIPCREWA